METATKTVPAHFTSLQTWGFACSNYYMSEGGKSIGLKEDILSSVGLVDHHLWIHPDLLDHLIEAHRKIVHAGFGLMVKDAWRPADLYDIIAELRERKDLEVKRLFNLKSKIHATGMAVDVVLTNKKTGEVVWTRDEPKDGQDSLFIDFYRGRSDFKGQEYQKLQDILVESFLSSGFQLGSKKEYFHFELPQSADAERF